MPVKKQTNTPVDSQDSNLVPEKPIRKKLTSVAPEVAVVAENISSVVEKPVVKAPEAPVSTPVDPTNPMQTNLYKATRENRSGGDGGGYTNSLGNNSNNNGPRIIRRATGGGSNMGNNNNNMRSNNNNNNNNNNRTNQTSYSTQNNNQPRPSQNNEDPQYYTGETVAISGLLEILPDYGVIRQKQKADDYLPRDVYISHSQIKRFNLRMGDFIKGLARPPKEGERYLSLLKIETVEGFEPDIAKRRPSFADMTAIFPNKWLKLETEAHIVSTRMIDLIAPIGRGQRAMLVAPPKAGKTWLLKDIANGITTNYPEVILFVALIGERPEEVTHFSRSVKGDVYASNFDERAEEQTRVAELCLERAKRLAERGNDVVILMDSLTRLARAYNMVAPPSGRTLTGGFDPAALYPAKHFFGAARNFEEAGSLTIIATALVETGSRMDDVIFEEFKGTGNMELRLDRALAERRIYPSIDIKASSTRHDEQLFDTTTFDQVLRLRRMVDLLDERDATELVMDRLKKSKNNKEFLDTLHKGA